jgi:hypothetical protein
MTAVKRGLQRKKRAGARFFLTRSRVSANVGLTLTHKGDTF